MAYNKRITSEQKEILKQLCEENKSITIMMLKTGLSRETCLNALRKYFHISNTEALKLGTPFSQFNKQS